MSKKDESPFRVSIDEQVEAIMFGAEYGDKQLYDAMKEELRQRLREAQREGRPLRVYAGYDPSAPDIHLGHTITLRKLKQFQDFGHQVTFLIGTFTAMVGDTSDKSSGRPRKSREETEAASASYADQCFKILDKEKTEVRYNADWLAPLSFADVVELTSNFTVQQFLARDNYKRRLEAGDPVGLHEFLYPIMQGYDAVELRCDVQIGATEQLFNIMAGRKLQQVAGQSPSIPITYPILVGVDGKERMSKSKGNYIGIDEAPEEQFGKTMSVSDETMLEFVKYVTRWPREEYSRIRDGLREGKLHPMETKKKLAWEIVSMYHGDGEADRAQAHFERIHQRRKLPKELPQLEVASGTNILDVLVGSGAAPSKSQARRLVEGRGVKLDGEVVAGYDHVIQDEEILQVGKRRFFQLRRPQALPS